jgi:hypothetical protein
MEAPVIRISILYFDAGRARVIEKKLIDSKAVLEPAFAPCAAI